MARVKPNVICSLEKSRETRGKTVIKQKNMLSVVAEWENVINSCSTCSFWCLLCHLGRQAFASSGYMVGTAPLQPVARGVLIAFSTHDVQCAELMCFQAACPKPHHEPNNRI